MLDWEQLTTTLVSMALNRQVINEETGQIMRTAEAVEIELRPVRDEIARLEAEHADLLLGMQVCAGHKFSFGLSDEEKEAITRAHLLCKRLLLAGRSPTLER